MTPRRFQPGRPAFQPAALVVPVVDATIPPEAANRIAQCDGGKPCEPPWLCRGLIFRAVRTAINNGVLSHFAPERRTSLSTQASPVAGNFAQPGFTLSPTIPGSPSPPRQRNDENRSTLARSGAVYRRRQRAGRRHDSGLRLRIRDRSHLRPRSMRRTTRASQARCRPPPSPPP